MFKYFNNFVDARPNGLDVLICDEAHRIRQVSANRYTRPRIGPGVSKSMNCSMRPECRYSCLTSTKSCGPVR